MSTSRDTRSLTLKHSDSRLNFVAICSRTREMPGGKVPPPTCRCDILFWTPCQIDRGSIWNCVNVTPSV